MKTLPVTDNSLLLRTDFSDDSAWSALCVAAQAPSEEEGFMASLDCVSDRAYKGATVEQLIKLVPDGGYIGFIFVADQLTFAHDESPILVVDLVHEPGRTFRVIPREMWGVENNLSLANMDFSEFADGVDPDGVFRGFPSN